MCAPLLARPAGYERRDPQGTVLHKIVRENIETFWAEMEEAGIELPRTVRREFEAYLLCGDLSAGFLRGECEACRRAILVAFSCKRRTVCASCGAKRMAATAAHLVDRVLPFFVPVRHWVLSLPFDVRYPLTVDRKLLSAVLRIFVDEIFKRNRERSVVGKAGQPGAVAAIHRADSSLRVNPHFHLIVLDGAYEVGDDEDAVPKFRIARAPTDDELRAIATNVAKRVRRLFLRRGLIDEDGMPLDDIGQPLPDGPVQFGWLTEDGEALIAEPDRTGRGTSCAEVAGFSVFAGRAVDDRDEIEGLARYVTRPPFANEQLSETKDGRVAVQLKRPRANGTTHAFMQPVAFLRRLTSLIPPAGMNLTRYRGILAPAAKHRDKVVPVPEIDLDVSPVGTEPVLPPRRSGLDWHSLLKRVWDIDALQCSCGGRIRIIAAIEAPSVIRRILDHVGIRARPQPVAPARGPPVDEGWFDSP